jgi:2-oxoglutarate dehydrogenase E1 component
MGEGSTFHRLLYDDAEMLKGEKISLVPDDKVRRVVICSGKVYFDLYEEREARGIDDIYILRVEQLYPFPLKAMGDVLSRFPAAEIVWCQEEPQNMGAWTFVAPRLEAVLEGMGAKKPVRYAGRAASASTATGLMSKHTAQRDQLIEEALGG